MNNLINYVRNRNPLGSDENLNKINTAYSNLEEDDTISVNRTIPKSYSSTEINKKNEHSTGEVQNEADTSNFFF
jgi:hypothetical protein